MGHPAWLGQSPHGWGIGKIWENHLEMEDVPAMNGRMKLLVEGFTCSLRTQNARRPNSHLLAGHIAPVPRLFGQVCRIIIPLGTHGTIENHVRNSLFISLACRRGQEVPNNNQLVLSLSSKLLIKCLPKIPDTRTNCVVLDIAILVLIWRNSSTFFSWLQNFTWNPKNGV